MYTDAGGSPNRHSVPENEGPRWRPPPTPERPGEDSSLPDMSSRGRSCYNLHQIVPMAGVLAAQEGMVGRQDLAYRLLFSHRRTVEELVCGFVKEPWVDQLDFTTLKRANASFVSPELKGRDGDLLWKLRLRDGAPAYVYLFIEHQSRV
ncbi:MAG TPA: hypothetical protein DD490_04680, partial [Acidobacteria bacterium]|nr:hypothetical protein [Acidobacteriota bacterium]